MCLPDLPLAIFQC